MAMKRQIITLTVFILSAVSAAQGQGFTEVSNAMGIDMRNTGNSILGVGMSFADFDRDGWDDLTYCSSNDSLVIYRNLGGTGFQRMEIFPFTHDSKMATWIDYDNDGDADLLWTKRSGSTRLFRNNGDLQFTDVTTSLGITTNPQTHIYGCAWGDFDRDGWLDVHICTYSTVGNSRNFLCRNNGDGTFTDVSSAAGVANLGSLTFQSAWQDFNGDMWPDLYVINDNNEDNKLYINDQDGTFTDITASAGVATNVQSMNIGIADYDHDQDWDIYVTDALDPNILWRNNGDLTFTNVSAEANLEVNSFCWAGTWVDFDHDTWDDIYVATATNLLNQDFFYRNNGDGTFSDANIPSINTSQLFTYAAGRGDFNNDGFWDISVTCTGDTSYLLYQGIPTDNHWVKLELEGTFSNRDAIGTHIDYYVNGQRYIKYTRCGEDFLTQHSTREILSLGNATQIDSLVITWPRGLVEKLYNVIADTTYHLVEGQQTDYHITASASALCGDPVVLSAGNYASFVWNDASTNDSLLVSSPGEYSVMVIDANGYTFTDTLSIAVGTFIDYTASVTQPVCVEDNIGAAQINSSPNVTIQWEDNNESFDRSDLAPGWYTFELNGTGYCSTSDSVQIVSALGLSPTVITTDVACNGSSDGSIAVSIAEPIDSIVWNNGALGDNITALSAATYTAIIYYNGQCTSQLAVDITEPEPIEVELTVDDVSCFDGSDGSVDWVIAGGTPPYNATFSNAQNSNLPAADYILNIADSQNCAVDSTITISQPSALGISNVDIVNANDGANGSITIAPEGGTPPYQYDWSNGSDIPNPDQLAQGDYSVTITDAEGCSLTQDYFITDIHIHETSALQPVVFPNPAHDRISVQLPWADNGTVELWNAHGQCVRQISALGQKRIDIDVRDLSSGCYMLRWVKADSTTQSSVLIVR